MKLRLLAFLLVWFGVAQAQTQTAPQTDIEITHKSAAEIPPEYASGALKPRKPFTVRYTCPESGRLYVVFDQAQQTAVLEIGSTTRYLKQAISASGARYVNSDTSYVFWVKGKEAKINDRETCVAD